MRRPARAGAEDGQITLLVIGFAVILLALVAVVVDASQVVLLRRTLASAADGAALVAAQSAAEESLYAQSWSGSGRLPLDPGLARSHVREYLAGLPLDLAGIDVGVSNDTVTVRLAATADLPLVGAVTQGFAGTTVVATARARSPLR